MSWVRVVTLTIMQLFDFVFRWLIQISTITGYIIKFISLELVSAGCFSFLRVSGRGRTYHGNHSFACSLVMVYLIAQIRFFYFRCFSRVIFVWSLERRFCNEAGLSWREFLILLSQCWILRRFKVIDLYVSTLLEFISISSGRRYRNIFVRFSHSWHLHSWRSQLILPI